MKGPGEENGGEHGTNPLAEIVRMQPKKREGKSESKEQSEFNDKVVRDYRIIKPIGRYLPLVKSE